MNREEIYNLCKRIATKENIDFKYIQSESENINLNGYKTESYSQNIGDVLFIRVIEKNNIGTFSVQDLRKEKILEGVAKAKEIAKLKKSTVKYTEFGKFKSSQKIRFEKEIENVNFSEIITKVEKNLIKEKKVIGYIGGLSKNTYRSFYINGWTEKECEKTAIMQETCILTKNKKKSSGEFTNVYTRVKDIDIDQNFLQARINAKNLLDPVKGEKGDYTLILTPDVTKSIISFILEGTNGGIIGKKKSFLHEYIGKKIFSEKFTLTEKPHLDYFLKSQGLDDEGIKTTEKEIFKNGVFRKPIYDLYNSIKYGKNPTGNGFLARNYSASYTNIVQEKGKKSIEDIINHTKKGIMVYQIMGEGTNKMTEGDFSLTIASGKEIVNGEYKKTVTNLTFSGNFKEILKEIEFSKEQLFFGASLYSFMVIPKVKLI